MQEEKNEVAELRKEIESLNEKINIMSKQLSFAVDRQYYFNAFTNPELQKLQNIPDHGILLCGNYGNPNTGDEWMMDTMISYIRRYTTKKITIMMEPNRLFDPSVYLKYGIEYIHYPKTIYDYDIIEKKFDVLIFGGGAIIEDGVYWEAYDYGINICRTIVDLPLRFIAKQKKVFCIGLSTSAELNNQEYIYKLQKVIDGATCFSLRDPYSIETLKRAGINTDKVHLIHDIVYSNNELQKAVKLPRQCNSDQEIIHIGVVYIVAEETKPQFRYLIEKLKIESEEMGKKCEITIIPFYDDWHIDYRFYMEETKEDPVITVLQYDSNIKSVIDIFMKQDVMVCARYHAILLALSLEIPCVALYYDTHQHYHNKIAYLMEQFGLDIKSCIAISELENTENLLKENITNISNKMIEQLRMDSMHQLNELFEQEL